ncbi:sigma-70 family RNA polymerase sigma factor [Ginsengibacter hankyongi]|uniref:Sigma-70 family RNA polymerase sigma factor n=1 Tax=Ginsengibacter hankyongi TaxID=2607284 RepID=A0A5J5IFU8_9BACT|nr:sigma-70 family RNA polymerase sigma factor [Ginsengibacter hankyongi]KAA9038514.1 sigma-70 family RNA polymerase sigma factor [Ginsengibacter hankyongi]
MQLISAEELNLLIRGCTLNKRESQKKLYNSFYSYGMAICDRYTKRKEDSIEIFNDSFLKIFKEIHRYKPSYVDEMNSFKGWIRKIMIYTAIDHNRKYHKHDFNGELEKSIIYLPADDADAYDMISYDEIINAIRELSPAYRTVINLFIIDGFSHEEISDQLGIAVGTSKSNLSKARQQLQKILKKDNQILRSKNVG